jgi:hypothetical protein
LPIADLTFIKFHWQKTKSAIGNWQSFEVQRIVTRALLNVLRRFALFERD